MKLPEPRVISPRFSAWLDFFRWTAALAVCLAHTRAGVLVDYDPQAQPRWLAQAVYFLPGFAHLAVMVFFVLSGYLVGGEILRGLHRGDFNWRRYAIRRLARLYATYVVALVLCTILDNVGLHFFNAAGLYSLRENFFTMITYPIDLRLGVTTWLGNLFFCQTVLVPTYGSNGALWSLANEAWYYALFPLALWPFCAAGSRGAKLACFALFAAAAWFVGRDILLYFSIWLLGLVPHFLTRPLLSRVWPAAVAFCAALAMDRFHFSGPMTQFHRDVVLAVTFVFLLNALEYHPRVLPGPAGPHRFLAGFSYSVYLLHWPVALFLIAVLQQTSGFGFRMPFSLAATGLMVLLMGGIYAASWLLAQLTERNTNRVREWLLRITGDAAPGTAGEKK